MENEFYPKVLSPSQKRALKNEKVQNGAGVISALVSVAYGFGNGEKTLYEIATRTIVGYSMGRFGASLFYPVRTRDILNQPKNVLPYSNRNEE